MTDGQVVTISGAANPENNGTFKGYIIAPGGGKTAWASQFQGTGVMPISPPADPAERKPLKKKLEGWDDWPLGAPEE